MKKATFGSGRLLFLLFILFLITACAETVPLDPASLGDPAGFWKGLWHGLILVVSFVISLFNDNVAVYAANNIGGWYDLGFLLGVLCMAGGGGRSTSRC